MKNVGFYAALIAYRVFSLAGCSMFNRATKALLRIAQRYPFHIVVVPMAIIIGKSHQVEQKMEMTKDF